ncbi:MAG: 23S rRNA (uracil(1939)-C(5))-methyltransferase RlmD [Anaeroplasmataceae bacterium]|nr:23S rRNA (uracil(1939)-C(5))-methyltransferase RlmD [Anaeroplasmataceae bacterium]
MEVGKVIKLEIEDYDMNGLGVSHIDGIVVFVSKALKGEVVLAELTHIHKKYAFATATKILTSSVDRILSPCPYAEGCGGCDLLHMKYNVECRVKENKVKNAFRLLNKNEVIHFNPMIQNKNILGYRNKIMLPFGYDEDENVIYGFYQKLTHSIISIDRCEISNHYVNEVVEFIRRFVSVMHIRVYDEETHSGIFRGVMVRNNYKNEMMVVLITTQYYDFSRMLEYIEEDFPLVKSMFLCINPNRTNVVMSGELIHIYKDKTLTEDILGLKFDVSAFSFMQVNHDVCEQMYLEAFRMANLTKDMNVIDAYCGMGSITLNIAKQVNHVYGIELVEDAILNANYNKELNHISNATFICGPCEEEIKKLVNKEKIDCIFFDPPRKGCEQTFLDTVIEMNIPKIIYISCNIATAVRDITYLSKNNYEVIEVTPCDLFSKTSHVESICSLAFKAETK